MASSVVIQGTRYIVGGRLLRKNQYGQWFYGTIVGIWEGNATSRPCLHVQRDETQPGSLFNVEPVNPEDYCVTRYWSPAEVAKERGAAS